MENKSKGIRADQETAAASGGRIGDWEAAARVRLAAGDWEVVAAHAGAGGSDGASGAALGGRRGWGRRRH